MTTTQPTEAAVRWASDELSRYRWDHNPTDKEVSAKFAAFLSEYQWSMED